MIQITRPAALESGRKYERKVQTLLEKYSAGRVFRNVKVCQVCEFDAIVEDYPLLNFIEIKRYRSDLNPQMVRTAVLKLRRDCVRIVNDTDQYLRYWQPYMRQKAVNGTVTYMELLLSKLNITPIEGWRFRMVLIVPNTTYQRVISALIGQFMKEKATWPRNIIDVEGIPLIVVREQAIPLVFG